MMIVKFEVYGYICSDFAENIASVVDYSDAKGLCGVTDILPTTYTQYDNTK